MVKVVDQSSFRTDLGYNISEAALADDFTLSSAVDVNKAVVYLTDNSPSNGQLDTFGGTLGWAIYSNNGGKPGTIIASGSDASPVLTDTGQNLGPGGDIFKAEIDFGSDVHLEPGTYWLVLREGALNSNSDGSTVFWSSAGSGSSLGDADEANPTLWNITISRNLAFALISDHGPVFTTDPALFTVENRTAVASIAASDVDGDQLTFSITGGADAGLFSISADGALSFIAAPDFENPADSGADGNYQVEVTVDDGTGKSVAQIFSVTVTNGNDRPAITSDGGKLRASVDVAENSNAVTKVQAEDIDGSSITYAISGGDDRGMFAIDAATGKITFKSAPDFENPSDKDHDNAYQITVRATDSGGAIDVQYLTINVTNELGVDIIGSSEADVINASQSAPGQPRPTGEEDIILGGGGKDRINGLGGNDNIEGGALKDILKGGAGRDTFFYTEVADSNATTGIDVIRDFTQGEDQFALSSIDADGAFHFLGEADFDGTAGALRQRTVGSDVFLEGDTDGNGVADLVILLKGSAGLVLTDADLGLAVIF